MRVALNAIALLSPLTGIGQYTYHLAKGLMAEPGLALDLFYGTGWGKELRDKPAANISNLKALIKRIVPRPYTVSRKILQYRFSSGIRSNQSEIYHEPNFLAYKCPRPSVITVHDLSWIRFPETHPVERVRAMDKYFQPGLERASLILTDSEFVKRELIEVFGVKPGLILPVPLGVEPLFRPQSAVETLPVLGRHGLSHGQYVLAVGTLEPRKNLEVALRAFMQLAPPLRKRFPLVLVGMKGWHTSALEQQIAPLVAAGEIRLLGYLPREDLATIIAGASALVYPSIYEGFGLPPLEAMACGVPVITSNVSSLPEVVGDAGIMLAPQDMQGIAEAMEMLLTAPDVREAFARKALARSAGFTWESCVSQTVAAYRRVLNSA